MASALMVVWGIPIQMIFCRVVTLPSVSPRLFAAVPKGVTMFAKTCTAIGSTPNRNSGSTLDGLIDNVIGRTGLRLRRAVTGQRQQRQVARFLPPLGIAEQG